MRIWLDFLLFLQNINIKDFIYVIIGFIVGFTLGFSLARHIIKKPKYTRQYATCVETIFRDYREYIVETTFKDGLYFSFHCQNLQKDTNTCNILKKQCPLNRYVSLYTSYNRLFYAL